VGGLKGKFAGYETDGVIVAASSPATESAEKVMECQKNGAAAAILKTASKTRMAASEFAPQFAAQRRCLVRDGFFWAKSSFNREILTLEQGEALVRGCKDIGVAIPVAASVTELTLDAAQWLEDCARMEAAGADAIQLDFFYIENMLSEPDFENRFVALLRDILGNVRIPVMPKLNIALPAGYAARLLKQGGITYVSLLDSIKTLPPVFFDRQSGMTFDTGLNGGGLSVFGSFMLPVTAQYTETLATAGFEICAGGGVTGGGSAANLLLLGASSVQVATDVLLNGYRRFAALHEELDRIERDAVSPHFPGRSGSLSLFHELGREIFGGNGFLRHASLRADACNPTSCGQECIRQTFCSIVRIKEGKPAFAGCEGCGLCANVCPSGSIEMVTHDCF